MKINKFLLSATVVASLFAYTVPASFAGCPCQVDVKPSCGCESAAPAPCDCGCDKAEAQAPACGVACPTDEVAPCNATCSKCSKLQSDCNCPKEITTGAAAPACDSEKSISKQSYAYPNAVYGNSNTTILGEEKDTAVLTDKMGHSKGVFIENTDCATGAAAPIIGDTCLDKVKVNDCGCGAEKASSTTVQSPTSIQATERTIETLKMSKGMTGAAASMGEFYPDVPENFWAAPEINRLTDKCIAQGYPNGLFKPSNSITRAEMASLVVKGYNLDGTPLSSQGDFCDVPKSHWAYEQINKAATNDMVKGYSNDTFKPNGKITRAEALTIVSKGLKCPMDEQKADEILSKYSDASSIPCWAKEPIAKAIDNGALENTRTGSSLQTNKKATRAEVSSMLQNMRAAGGYDSSVRSACGDKPIKKTYVEKESMIAIPTLELTMNDMVNSKNANVGDQFSASTINPITIGSITFPAGSRVNGKVVEVIRPTKNSQGAIKLSFNQILCEDGTKYSLPKQILTARVDNAKNVNGFARTLLWPFTWSGSLLGTTGRAVGGMVVGAANAAENVLDNFGTGTSEAFTGQFRAAGRSYQDSAKALVVAPVDFTRTALSGTLGLFQTTADEVAYLVDKNGMALSQVNPKEKITIAFGH
jgi:hypothetical protein